MYSIVEMGCPHDNTVAEVEDKIIKTEFVKNTTFETQEQSGYEFAYYINWYHNYGIHSSF